MAIILIFLRFLLGLGMRFFCYNFVFLVQFSKKLNQNPTCVVDQAGIVLQYVCRLRIMDFDLSTIHL